MQKFATLYHRALERDGSEAALVAKSLASNYNDHLEDFTKHIFQSGFNWSIDEMGHGQSYMRPVMAYSIDAG